MKQIQCRSCEGRGFFMVREVTEADEILVAVALEHGVGVDRLRGPSRGATLCRARFHAAKMLREAGYSLKEIGYVLGGRDHSTIIHALKRAESLSVEALT